jgi:hypothetical protein
VSGRTADPDAHRPPSGRGSTITPLPQLRRIRWAVRATLVLGVAASVVANVLHAFDNPISQTIAAWPPLALLLTVELISRVPVHRRSLAAARLVATATIAGIAAWVSYWHMVGVAARYGETGASPYLLPLSVDGLIVVASICLVELGGRIATAQQAIGAATAPAARATSDIRSDSTSDIGSDTAPPPRDHAPPVPTTAAPAARPAPNPERPDTTAATPGIRPARIPVDAQPIARRSPRSGPLPPAATVTPGRPGHVRTDTVHPSSGTAALAPALVSETAPELSVRKRVFLLCDRHSSATDRRSVPEIADAVLPQLDGAARESVLRYIHQWRKDVESGRRIPDGKLRAVPDRIGRGT